MKRYWLNFNRLKLYWTKGINVMVWDLKKFLFAVILTCSFEVSAYAEEAVYRWIDENGTVHYSDQPRSDDAKLFILRQYNKAQPVATAEEVAANNDTLSSINKKATKSADLVAKNGDVSPEQACDYIREQMAQAQLALNSNDPVKVQNARVYLDTADNLLVQSQCK